jgi:uncharacterized protein
MRMNASTTAVDPIVEQKIQIPYSYVAGPAVSRFLTGLKDCVFYAGECTACGRKTVPPISFCGRCWMPISTFVLVGPTGVLESFAAIPNSNDPNLLFALIRLNGSDTWLTHWLEVPPGDLPQIGLEVEPVWKEEREGSVLDIRCFRPAKSG